MKAICGSTLKIFTNKILCLAAFVEKETLTGILYTGNNSEQMLVLDEDVKFRNRDEAYSELAAGHIIKVDNEERKNIALPDGTCFSVLSKQEIKSMEELVFRCALSHMTPESYWTDDVIVCLKNKDDAAKITEMLFARDNNNIACIVLKDSESPYLLRVKNISIYVVLYCLGEQLGNVYYRVKDDKDVLNYFVTWGTSYPLLKSKYIKKSGDDRNITIVPTDRDMLCIDQSKFKNIHTSIIPEFAGIRQEYDTVPENVLNFSIKVRLRTADKAQARVLPQTELWIVPPSQVDLFTKDLYCPESALKQLEGIAFTTQGLGNCIALWTGGSGEELEGLSLASLSHPEVKAFYRSPHVNAPLFLPKGHLLFPLLKPETLKALFNIEKNLFTVILPDEKMPSIIAFRLGDFKPVRKALVNYTFMTNQAEVETAILNPVYDFEKPVAYPKVEPVEKKIKSDLDPSHDMNERKEESMGLFKGSPEQPRDAAASGKQVLGNDENKDESNEAEPLPEEPAKPKTPEELLAEKAHDFIERYSGLSHKDWRNYMRNAMRTEDYKKDAYAALATLLLLYPQSSRIAEDIKEALGLRGDNVIGNFERSMKNIFDEDKKNNKEPEITLFKLAAAMHNNRMRNTHIPKENTLRASLSELGHRIFRTKNPKFIWLFCNMCFDMTRDEQIIEQGRIQVQNLLYLQTADPGIPRMIRRELTSSYLRQNVDEIEQFSRLFPFTDTHKVWFRLLICFYLENNEFYEPYQPFLDAVDQKLTAGEFTGISADDLHQIEVFSTFLKECVTCNRAHPLECDYKNHLTENDNVYHVLDALDIHPGKADDLDGWENNAEIIIQFLREIRLPEEAHWPFLKKLVKWIDLLNRSGSDQAEKILAQKLHNWKELSHENETVFQAINILCIGIRDDHKKDIIETFTKIFDSLATLKGSPMDKMNLFVLGLNILTATADDIDEKLVQVISNAVLECGFLIDNDKSPISNDEITLIYSLVHVLFCMSGKKSDNLSRVIHGEKQKIREVVARQYTKQQAALNRS